MKKVVVVLCIIYVTMLSCGIETIGDEAFKNCSSLTSVSIPDSMTSIGNYAFYGCRNLASVTFADTST